MSRNPQQREEPKEVLSKHSHGVSQMILPYSCFSKQPRIELAFIQRAFLDVNSTLHSASNIKHRKTRVLSFYQHYLFYLFQGTVQKHTRYLISRVLSLREALNRDRKLHHQSHQYLVSRHSGPNTHRIYFPP